MKFPRATRPRRAVASEHHAKIYGLYEKVYTLVEFAAAVSFIIGSVLFFNPSQQIPATWFFLIGSILFAVRPTVRVLRENHLARVPLPGDDRSGSRARTKP